MLTTVKHTATASPQLQLLLLHYKQNLQQLHCSTAGPHIFIASQPTTTATTNCYCLLRSNDCNCNFTIYCTCIFHNRRLTACYDSLTAFPAPQLLQLTALSPAVLATSCVPCFGATAYSSCNQLQLLLQARGQVPGEQSGPAGASSKSAGVGPARRTLWKG